MLIEIRLWDLIMASLWVPGTIPDQQAHSQEESDQVSFTWAWHSEKNLYLIFVSSPWHSCSWAPAPQPHHRLRSVHSWKPGELHGRTVVFCLGLLSCLPSCPPVQGASRPLWLKWSEPWESSRRWGQKDHCEIRSCKALQVIVRTLTFILNSVGRHPRFAQRSGKTWCVLVEPFWLLWRKSEVSQQAMAKIQLGDGDVD